MGVFDLKIFIKYQVFQFGNSVDDVVSVGVCDEEVVGHNCSFINAKLKNNST
jgi:hypothetical protein